MSLIADFDIDEIHIMLTSPGLYCTIYNRRLSEKGKIEFVNKLGEAITKAFDEGDKGAYEAASIHLQELLDRTEIRGELDIRKRLLEIKRRIKEKETKATIKNTISGIYSLTNFNEVIEIINIYQKNNINEEISGAINGKMYTIAKNGNSIMISCDGKKGLCINFNVTPDFIATLSFTYINAQTSDNQAFFATLNGWSYNSIKGNAASVLSRSLIPITNDGRLLSWEEARKHQEAIMDNSELQAVIGILIDYTNSDKAEKQDTATI